MPQTIVITGASSGLGRASALLFAARGWQVVATMRDPAAHADLAATPGITLLALDVTDPAQIAGAAAAALSSGPVDVLFNNAGYGLAGAFEGVSDAQLTAQISTNLLGVMRVTQAFLPAMRARGQGMILTTTSIGGLVTFPFNAVYHATKWGLEGWSESLAFELAPHGIAVRTIAPGGIATDFAGRSLVFTPHPAYAEAIGRTLAAFRDPDRGPGGSTAEQIAEEAWVAVHAPFTPAAPGPVTHVAGDDARALVARRRAIGIEAYRDEIRQRFLG